MLQPLFDGIFTGPLRIDVALRFDTLGEGASRPLVALGKADGPVELIFGQSGNTGDLVLHLVQGGTSYRLLAQDALQTGETANFSAQIDDAGLMAIFKDDTLLAERAAEVPLALGIVDLRGPETPFDAEVIDLTVEALSPAETGGGMAIVAHPDDDLLFMNPTVADTIAAGEPQTTVYVTAGDAGQGAAYWEAREAGVKAAYAQMAGSDPTDWIDETVTLELDGTAYEVSSSYLESAPQVRLYFLRTPDGTDGGGTDAYGFDSLEKLWDGSVAEVVTVDGAASYTSSELTDVLAALMARHAPDNLLLQDDVFEGEHSDHLHVTDFAEAALPVYGGDLTVTRFRSYDTSNDEENLSDDEIDFVTGIFETYAAFDPAVTDDTGAVSPPYAEWLLREYVAERYLVVDGERLDVPDPENPQPVDPEPDAPGPEEPPVEDPGPEEPPVEDPAPADPEPEVPPTEDTTPVSPGNWSGNVFGAGGIFGNLLSSPLGVFGGTVPGATPPTDLARPVEPPADPLPGTGPARLGGLYEALMLDDPERWAAPDSVADENDLAADLFMA